MMRGQFKLCLAAIYGTNIKGLKGKLRDEWIVTKLQIKPQTLDADSLLDFVYFSK